MSDITNVNEISVTGVYVDKTNGFVGVNDSAPVNTAHIKTTGTEGLTLPILRITDDKASGVNYTAIEIVDDALAHGMTNLTYSTKTAGTIGVANGTDAIGGMVVSGYNNSQSSSAVKLSGVNAAGASVGTVVIDFASKNGTGKTEVGETDIGLDITNNGTSAVMVLGSNAVKLAGAFGCNGATPQVPAVLGAAATDPASTETLVNNIRTALMANGIGVQA